MKVSPTLQTRDKLDRHMLTCGTGAVKVFDATAAAGVKRFIIVSAVDIRDRENKHTPAW